LYFVPARFQALLYERKKIDNSNSRVIIIIEIYSNDIIMFVILCSSRIIKNYYVTMTITINAIIIIADTITLNCFDNLTSEDNDSLHFSYSPGIDIQD